MTSATDKHSVFEGEIALEQSSFTQVSRGRHVASGKDAVIKRIRLDGLPQARRRRASFEVRTPNLCEPIHPALPVVLAWGDTVDGDVFLSTQWVDGARLVHDPEARRPKALIRHLETTGQALSALADRGLALLNLRPSNLYLRRDGTLMITGLGTGFVNPEGCFVNPDGSGDHDIGHDPVTGAGAPAEDRFRAPEIGGLEALERPECWRADLYSLARVTVELLGAQLRDGDAPSVSLPAELPLADQPKSELERVLEQCLHADPDERLPLPRLIEQLRRCRDELDGDGLVGADTMETAVIDVVAGGDSGLDPGLSSPVAEPDADSVVVDLRKMWSEGLADIDLQRDADAMQRPGDREHRRSDPIVTEVGTEISAEQRTEFQVAQGVRDDRSDRGDRIEQPSEVDLEALGAFDVLDDLDRRGDPGAPGDPGVAGDLGVGVIDLRGTETDPDHRASTAQAPGPVPASEWAGPPRDLYKAPFFAVAAMAGLLLIAFLWALSRPTVTTVPDPRPSADAADPAPTATDVENGVATDAASASDPGAGGSAADLGLAGSTPAVEAATLPESVITDLPRQPETPIPTRIAAATPTVQPEPPPAAVPEPTPARPPTPAQRSDPKPAADASPTPRSTASPTTPPPAAAETRRDRAARSPGDVPPARPTATQPATTAGGPRALPELPLPLAEIVAVLESALRSGAYGTLTTTLGALTQDQEQELQRHPKARAALEFSRLAVDSVRSIEAALPLEPLVALRDAHRLSNQFPAIEASAGLRDRAATAIEQRGASAVSAGDVDTARTWFRELEREWPERPNLGVRLAAVERLAANERARAAIGRIEELERDLRLHSALEELSRIETELPPTQTAEIRSRIERRFEFLDQRPPTVELDPTHEIVATQGAALEIRLRVEDDYRVNAVRAFARAESGDIVELAVSSEGERYYAVQVPAEIRESRIISIWAEADDLSGHTGKLGSAEQPIRIRPRRR